MHPSLASAGRAMRPAFPVGVALLAILLSLASQTFAAQAPARRGSTRPIQPHTIQSIVVTPSNVPEDLLRCLLGPDVTVSNVVLSGADSSMGTFTGGLDIVGIGSGIVLSSGRVRNLVGPNLTDDITYDNNFPGDANLDSLVPGYETFDAAYLQFDFECASPQAVSFQYVFTSDEYNEFVNSPFNDVFGFFLNDSNIAVVPSGCSDPGIPVAINNVDCGNPYVAAGGPNCNCYRNNDLNDGGPFFDTEMDGLTQVFYATAMIRPGLNHIKIAIADAGDHILDSNVMIACQSFTCAPPPATGACCFPNGTCVTLSYPQCYDQGGHYYGNLTPCDPEPCAEPVGACCMANGECEVEGQSGCERNGGTYQGDGTSCAPTPCVVSVDEDRLAGAGPRLSVAPNPSGGHVLIQYRLAKLTVVTIEILDAAGRQVRRLVNAPRAAGDHTLVWDGRNEAGERLPGGIYFAVARTTMGVTTKRMVMVR